MKKTIICVSALAAALSLCSCGKNNNITISGSNLVSVTDTEESAEIFKPTQLWHKSNSHVVVLFGYGYNDENFVEATKSKLEEKYGSSENDGRLISLVFPEDFKHGSRTYITDLANILSNKEVSALVILGAPEGTYKAIARMQDSYDGTLPFPVISLFSQDEVLGMEYSSDFILDKTQKAQLDGTMENESDQAFVKDVPALLERALYLADISESPFAKDAKLIEIVKMVTGKLMVSRYSDPETGLISINHFVLE